MMINYNNVLCSILVLRSVVTPTLQWVLPDVCPLIKSQESCQFGGIFRFYFFLRLGLIQLFYVSADFFFLTVHHSLSWKDCKQINDPCSIYVSIFFVIQNRKVIEDHRCSNLSVCSSFDHSSFHTKF